MQNRPVQAAFLLAAMAACLTGCTSLPWTAPPPDAVYGAPWRTDYRAAARHAAREDKYLLVHFGGSDWDEWSARLGREVLSQPAFLYAAADDFVLVSMDFPSRPENREALPPRYRKRNAALRERFDAGTLPAICLADPKGTPFARIGYRAGGPATYIAFLKKSLQQKTAHDEALATLNRGDLSDEARLDTLHAVLTATPPDIADRRYRPLMEEIASSTLTNRQHLATAYAVRLKRLEAVQAIRAKRLQDALAVYNHIVFQIKPTGQILQDVWMEKANVYRMLGDIVGEYRCLDDAWSTAPTGDKALRIAERLKVVRAPAVEEKRTRYAGTAVSTMTGTEAHPLAHAYDMNLHATYFLSDRPPQAGDALTIVLKQPVEVSRIALYTGDHNHPGSKAQHAVLEVSPDGRRFQQVAAMVEGAGKVRIMGAPLVAVRLRFTDNQDHPVAVRDMVLD